MTQTEYVTDLNDFYKIVTEDTLYNINIEFIKDDMAQINYTYKDQFTENSNNTNIFIACFTTSHARLILYKKLDYLGSNVIYYDTDSIMCVDDGKKRPETGGNLGNIKDELKGLEMKSFISTRPKSYSYVYGNGKQK